MKPLFASSSFAECFFDHAVVCVYDDLIQSTAVWEGEALSN